MSNLAPLRIRLEHERKRLNIPWNVLEQDYVISWVLQGIVQVPELYDNLIFKGGTALKKCYFGEYRFSEDLDYSCISNQEDLRFLEEYLILACDNAKKQMEKYIPTPTFIINRYVEKNPHPEGQQAFIIRVQLPWHREPKVKVMIEVTTSEEVILPPIHKNIIHNYGENLETSIKVYSLEEIIAEKLRAILQYTKKLYERGWARSRTRDFYDLWSIMNQFNTQINYKIIREVLIKKCLNKNISFINETDFFQDIVIKDSRSAWEQWLKPLVINLPDFDEVILDLKKKLAYILQAE